MRSRVSFSREMTKEAKEKGKDIVVAKFQIGGGVVHIEGLYASDEAEKLLQAFLDLEKKK